MLTDSFGRTLDYLRVSITDRCNLRCVYCMPAEGVESKTHDSMLRFEEILRLCRILIELGIRKIKVTGGEPLVRKGTGAFLRELKKLLLTNEMLSGTGKLTLTTNGFLLGVYLDEAESFALTNAPGSGFPLDAVNISLDALDRERSAFITRKTDINPEEIFLHVDRLLEKNIPVKINCVPIRGLNEDQIIPLAALAKDKNIAVRFIELMPLGSAAGLKPVPGTETAALLEKAFGKPKLFSGVLGNGPAVYHTFPGFAGAVGFINPLSSCFCESCNRLRLTSEGLLKLCLSSALSLDLRALLRYGALDSELAQSIREAAAKKPRIHNLEHKGKHPDGMFEIGG